MGKSIGALWSKTSSNGTAFFTGNIEIDGVKIDIVIFKNDKGENEKRPDYKIYKSRPKDEPF